MEVFLKDDNQVRWCNMFIMVPDRRDIIVRCLRDKGARVIAKEIYVSATTRTTIVWLKGQGKVRHVEACLGMPGHVRTCPGREPQTSPGGGPTSKPSNQELTRSPRTPITAEPAFSSLYGSPAGAIKPFPTPHTSQTPFASQTPFNSLLTSREFCPRATAQ